MLDRDLHEGVPHYAVCQAVGIEHFPDRKSLLGPFTGYPRFIYLFRPWWSAVPQGPDGPVHVAMSGWQECVVWYPIMTGVVRRELFAQRLGLLLYHPFDTTGQAFDHRGETFGKILRCGVE
ncbi:hypothetical protein Z051_03660 [Rhodococcus rhodochrous KG-21]|uniref:Uncharacterized protein n=1 Tax=Rhodococcus rhodochrous KG-21 TaxID=1441923 RepID=A0A0M8PJI8_RHORH|nr:hypothetical protein Z051_03660 [Rhodococcus rhodochrous KG-21]